MNLSFYVLIVGENLTLATLIILPGHLSDNKKPLTYCLLKSLLSQKQVHTGPGTVFSLITGYQIVFSESVKMISNVHTITDLHKQFVFRCNLCDNI